MLIVHIFFKLYYYRWLYIFSTILRKTDWFLIVYITYTVHDDNYVSTISGVRQYTYNIFKSSHLAVIFNFSRLTELIRVDLHRFKLTFL